MNDKASLNDPRHLYPAPPFPDQPQAAPGLARKMDPVPDHGEESYRGSGRLTGRKALITGGDSGIGRSAAIAFAREGADVAIGYLPDGGQNKSSPKSYAKAERNRNDAADRMSTSDLCGLPSACASFDFSVRPDSTTLHAEWS